MIKELMSSSLIRAHAEASSPEEAIRLAGDLLVEAGFATPEYVDAIIDTFHSHGPYIVIAPGIAMPHARPEAGARAMGFSIVTLKSPVVFGHPDNDPVSFLLALSAVDADSHLKALQELVGLLSDDASMEAILNAENPEQILAVINNI